MNQPGGNPLDSPDRRSLTFASWQEVRSDLDALQTGYEQAGKWNLAQVCLHLNDWLRFPMDGFPRAPFPMNLALPLLRMTMGKSELRKILQTGKMSSGTPTMPATVHSDAKPDDDRQAVADLKATIERFEAFSGELHPSPIFGAMDKSTTEKLQLVHFANHLSWLKPI